MKSFFLFFAAFLCLTTATNAQSSSTYKVIGLVQDSLSQKPLGFLTIALLNDHAEPVSVKLSGENGAFIFSELKPLQYQMVLQGVGVKPKKIKIDLSIAGTPEVTDLKSVYMTAAENKLKDVVVVGVRPLVQQKLDRISYDLQADPESKVNSVLDMMRKVPYLSLDGNNNLLMKGNSGFRIFINGKPTSLMERNPQEVLRSMPASTIERIEVITNPPAKYEAEGLVGIINIITIKRTTDGYNGSINTYVKGPVGGPGVGANFALKQNRFVLSSYAGGNIYNTPSFDGSYNSITNGPPQNVLSQASNRSTDSRSGYVGAELSYEVDSLNLLSGQVNLNGSRSNSTINLLSNRYTNSMLLEGYNLQNLANTNGHGQDASLNLQHNFRHKKNQVLTLSYRYAGFNSNGQNAIDIFNRINYTQPDYKQRNEELFRENTVQLDFASAIKKVGVELGGKAIWRHNGSNFGYSALNSATGEYVEDPTLGNIYSYDQDVYALYNSYQYGAKQWNFSGGVRAEQTVTHANFISSNTSFKQDYFNVVPSLSVGYNIKNSNFGFNFGQRIRRPSIVRTNPYVDRSNPNVLVTGNPGLRPVVLNNLQLSYGYSSKVSVNIGLGYSFFNNLDLKIYSFDDVSNITTITYANVGKGSQVGVDVNVNYPITQKLNLSLNGNIGYFNITGSVDDNLMTNTWVTYFTSASLGYAFGKGWRANENITVNGPLPNSFQGTTNGFVSSSTSINKELLQGKLTISAFLNNPFSRFRNNIVRVEGTGFSQRDEANVYFRSYGATLNYKFGRLKGGVSKSRKNINNDDVDTRRN